MKKLAIYLSLFLATLFGIGQEFKIYSNGLIYSDTTMSQLNFIVDSLNIKFRTCELHKTYYSKKQAKAHYVYLDSGDIKAAKADMSKHISIEAFKKKYPLASIEEDMLVTKYKYTNYDEIEMVEYGSILSGHEIDVEEKTLPYETELKGKWVFDYWEEGEYTDESLRAFYFITPFENKALPEAYARMIQYSNCMVDTSAQIFNDRAIRTGRYYSIETPSAVTKFMDYVHKETNRPKYNRKKSDDYWTEYRRWDSVRLQLIDSILIRETKFKDLLSAAVVEAIEKGGTDDEFEQYVGLYHSKLDALEMKRSRIVVGGCSMDNSPRFHAMNIAVLSAQTVNWETFLRAHLDIMNDRFERVSDGSYAWGARKTYIKELEELEIDVLELMIGISLRIENPSENHYFGSIGRLGRALAETKDAEKIENQMLNMIADNELDEYNRILMYYLFRNYNYFIEDETKQNENADKLALSVQKLPSYLSDRLKDD